MAFYRMSGSSKGELHGASVLVTVPDATAGDTVTLTMGSFSKSGILSDGLTCLFTDLLDAGTYTATHLTFSNTVELTANDILNKSTVPVTISQNLTITFAVEGAKEDNITITNGTWSDIAVIGTGQTTVEKTIVIPPELEGTEFTFTSSVAKDITDGTSDYSKKVVIDSSTTSVKIMPEGALYWYGNEVVPMAHTSIDFYYGSMHYTSISPTPNTNSYYCDNGAQTGAFCGMGNVNPINFTTVYVKIKGIIEKNAHSGDVFAFKTTRANIASYGEYYDYTLEHAEEKIVKIDTDGLHPYIWAGVTPTGQRVSEVYAIWVE